ncbi:MAG: 4-oxalocrotonate tautomerase [Desulfobulbaceae bacterium A2]|nr:MAG: 4-oxalocrotonate tautomerase [Desulfobulbaceae bacterium A2]
MPVIAVTMGPASKEQKQALVAGLTATAREITKIPEQHFIVTISELNYDSLGLGGKTVEEIRRNQS